MKQKLVVIGNGMAPGRVLDRLFESAPEAYEITIFNAETRTNYDRILLSPVLSGEKSYAEIVIHGDAWYEKHDVRLLKGQKIVAVDRAAKTVTAEGGVTVSYDKLLIATGSLPIVIPVPGHDLPGVLTYRDMDDVSAMLIAAQSGGSAVVIGGGLLGLEAAAGLKERGMNVTVVHLAPTLMERQLDPAAGHLLRRALEARGIEVITGGTPRRSSARTMSRACVLKTAPRFPPSSSSWPSAFAPTPPWRKMRGSTSTAAFWSMPTSRPPIPTSSRSGNALSLAAMSMAWSRPCTRWRTWFPPSLPASPMTGSAMRRRPPS
jgi:nitrite reductase (NADH) large subunit